MQKRLLAVHDLSCLGKCALTAVLPIVSSLGVECVPLPTALLSSHFAALSRVEVLDLTMQLEKIADCWAAEGVTFDGIYSGYLANPFQADLVRRLAERFDCPLLVDPVMADNGKLYRGFGREQVNAMKALCARADVITPNLTEACLLLDAPRGTDPAALLEGLSALGPQKIVLTSVSRTPDRAGAAVWDQGTITFPDRPRTPGSYSGAGDIFAAVLSACWVKGKILRLLWKKHWILRPGSLQKRRKTRTTGITVWIWSKISER